MTALGRLAWTDLAHLPQPPVLAVPLGSCEQHGPHLPLDTDTRIATALAHRLAGARCDVVVTAALPFGASWEHDGFPGLLSLNHQLITSVLVELARSADWSAGLILINGHGGNGPGVRAAIEQITAEGRHAMAWWPSIAGGDAHAGSTETSMMLALHPHLVRIEHAAPGWTGPAGAVVRDGVRAVSPNGVLGDPTSASAEHGHMLLDGLAADLVTTYDLWRAA
jgi:mycofactocin precursor peptide peptidase